MTKYFPLFADIKNRPVLIIGVTKEAVKKLEKLLPYSPDITVAAPNVSPDLSDDPSVTYISANPREIEDLVRHGGFRMVITADKSCVDPSVIYNLCLERGIEINTADDAENSTFIFPATAVKGKLTLAVSTEGASPAAAVMIRDEAEKAIPSNIEDILDWLASVRVGLRENSNLSAADRHSICRRLTALAFEKNRPLTKEELNCVTASLHT